MKQVISVNLETGEAFKASINPEFNKERFCEIRENFFLIDTPIDSTKSWNYNFEDNTIKENKEGSLLMNLNRNKGIAKTYLILTDKFMLIDNPNDFSKEEIDSIITFRKQLRKDNLEEIPFIPECLKTILEV